jgi:hypothetical protein
MRLLICIFSLFTSSYVLAQQNLNQPETDNSVDGQTVGKSKIQAFNISSGGDFLALLAYTGVNIELVEVDKNGKVDHSKKLNDKLSGTMKASGTRNGDKVNIVLAYTGANSKGSFSVKDATIKLEISTTTPIFTDYWRLSKATLDMNYSLDGTAATLPTLDILPRFGYSSQPADLQCGTGFSMCAPRYLSWSCGNNVLQKLNTTDVSSGSKLAVLSLQNLAIQPFAKGAQRIRFGANWDCDPLIPISLWSSILVTLGLASIVVWSLSMVGSIYSPSKFDDPKGAALMIAQTD